MLDAVFFIDVLNEYLITNGFKEQFELRNEHLLFLGNTYKNIKLYISEKEKYCGITYLDFHRKLNYEFNNIEEQICKYIARILKNEIVVLSQRDREGRIIFQSSLAIDLDVNSFNYTEIERNKIFNPKISVTSWSGNVSENVRLFAIGSLLTMHPEIAKRQPEFNPLESCWEKETDRVLWYGRPSKKAAYLYSGKIVGITFLVLTALCSLCFLLNWKLFLFFESVVVLASLIGFFASVNQTKNKVDYYITNRLVLIEYGKMNVLILFKEIKELKIKYGLFENRNEYGTIKIKASGFWNRIFSLNNNLISVKEPEKVYALLQEQINNQNDKDKNNIEKFYYERG